MKGKSKENIKTSNQLSFPDVTSYDHLKSCPRYTSSKSLYIFKKTKWLINCDYFQVLNRPDGDGVGIEEMDSLQMEIEALLVDAMQRTRNLKMELMILEDSSDKNEIIKVILNYYFKIYLKTNMI
jgi:transcriptional adapter 3